MMKKLSALLLAVLPLGAFAYSIEVTEKLTDTEITYDVQEVTYNMGGLLLRNHGPVAVRCEALFRNGPEAPRVRKVLLDPHSQKTLTAKFTREILRLRVELSCANAG